ncbi:CMGC SRPK kinase [Fusarium beomiforme]|uniref:non-specific serine/threonine protein kinase n=1 Tax=Fusarium beomiforme TaxID=44412 RepID=A0A9P5AQL0_9HYPO|nr:CMGC SRPK kinase [Fusarium beomiforme]
MADVSDSPPPTPQPPFEKRLKNQFSPGEYAELYRPGGYHPVHLGDVFNDGQYKVIRKLGEGSFSIVWLAHDLKNSRYVALKFCVSREEAKSQEVQILRHLAKVAPMETPQFVTQLLAEFEHKGPNGTHKCLVFEPMGPSVNQMRSELAKRKRQFSDKFQYPPEMAKRILRDSLKGLAFLHRNGISHADFQPGNMLFSLNNIDLCDEANIYQVEEKYDRYPIERIDGKVDKWAPQYLLVAKPLAKHTSVDENFKIKLSDMGGGLRSPELILKGVCGKAQDIWSFGCLVFEMITGQMLFHIYGPGSKTDIDDGHLMDFQLMLGPLPDELYNHWETSSLYYTKDREMYNCYPGGVGEGEEPGELESWELATMEERFDKASPDMTDEEADEAKKFIRWVLQYDPAKRPSAEEILRHPWFAEDSNEKAECN